jgi:hypothetical protein
MTRCSECGELVDKFDDYSLVKHNFLCKGPYLTLTREEKMLIISSCMEGMCQKVIFDEVEIKNKVKECLQIAEDVLNDTRDVAGRD